MSFLRRLLALTSGFGLGLVTVGLHQSSYDSLQGYCAYLAEPGHWTPPDAGFWILGVGANVFAVGFAFWPRRRPS